MLYLASKPTYTSTPDIAIPQAYQLASKTVNVKNLSKDLSVNSFQNDSIKTIITTYSRISQAVDIACDTVYLLPNLETKRNVPDFYKVLVPTNENHRIFPSIYNGYKALSNSLYNYFHSSTTILPKAVKVKEACNEVHTSADGFVYLTYILHKPCHNSEEPQFSYTKNSQSSLLNLVKPFKNTTCEP